MLRIFKRNIWANILGWTLLAVVLLFLIPMLYPAKLPSVYHVYHVILFGILFTVYYLNIRVILPNLIKRGINIYYILLFLGICALVISFMDFVEKQLNVTSLVYQTMHPGAIYVPGENKSYISYYLFFLTATVLAVGYINQLFRKWNLEERKNNEMKKRKAKAELESLKAQIQPHFFFNTLNTIYALTFTDIEKSQEAILKLSKMMRYVMNEENNSYVKLAEETSFIQNYLELMAHRLPKNVNLEFQLTQKYSNMEIAPMILLNFIKNCFKHGVSTKIKCFVSISTDFEGEYFVLKTENNWFNNRQNRNSRGIGIDNTRKRLEIIYPDMYTLEHGVKANRYHCRLRVKII